MTCFINVVHTVVKREALTLVKCKGAEDPGVCWVSWLCTTSAGETQRRALCVCAAGARG